MEILLEESMNKERSMKNLDWDNLSFSLNPTRSMYIATCDEKGDWEKGRLVPYGDVQISPASGVLNYG